MNYYNEIDPQMAEWLRVLIKHGAIPPGDVDERSIEDVRPNELLGYTQCHFFAGIGGWPHALQLAAWPVHRRIWTGSCPCQPFSEAGERAGFADERHLWPTFFHLIRECGPECIAGEQVASKSAELWLDLVQSDLEGIGYTFGAVEIPAAGFGAPHRRQRFYWVADAHGRRLTTRGGEQSQIAQPESGHSLFEQRGRVGSLSILGESFQSRLDGVAGNMGHSVESGLERFSWDGNGGHESRRVEEITSGPTSEASDVSGMADASTGGFGEHGNAKSNGGTPERVAYVEQLGSSGDLAESNSDGRHARQSSATTDGHGSTAGSNGGVVGLADPFGRANGRESKVLAQPDVRGLEEGDGSGVTRLGRTGPLDGFWRDADWIRCRDGKWRPVEPGSFPLAHGVPGRVGLLRGFGNAIVPESAAAFITAYQEATGQLGS